MHKRNEGSIFIYIKTSIFFLFALTFKYRILLNFHFFLLQTYNNFTKDYNNAFNHNSNHNCHNKLDLYLQNFQIFGVVFLFKIIFLSKIKLSNYLLKISIKIILKKLIETLVIN